MESETLLQETLAGSFTQSLVAEIRNRQRDGFDIVVVLDPDLTFYRPKAETMWPTDVKLTPAILATNGDRYGAAVMPFQRMLFAATEQMPEVRKARQWANAGLPIAVLQACGPAQRLLEQLGKNDPVVIASRGKLTPVAWLARQCQRDAVRTGALPTRCSRALVRIIRQRRGGANPARVPTMFSIQARGPQWEVVWMDDGPEVLWREPFDAFASPLTRHVARKFAGFITRMESTKRRVEDSAWQALRGVSPMLADAAKFACDRDKPVACRLAAATVRHTPAEVWAFLRPACDLPAEVATCAISVHRRHQEFVLEGPPPAGDLFYFPPTLLVARLIFAVNGTRLHYPLIRQPAGGSVWTHPYTGDLQPAALAEALYVGGHEEFAGSLLPTPQVQEAMPYLAYRTVEPMERDICLRGQDEAVANLCQRFGNEFARDAYGDVLGCVQGVWDLAKVGLTRAHQHNTQGPRKKMARGSMPNLIGRALLTDALARRVFPYDPFTSAADVLARKPPQTTAAVADAH
jgi:hypothetical protein